MRCFSQCRILIRWEHITVLALMEGGADVDENWNLTEAAT